MPEKNTCFYINTALLERLNTYIEGNEYLTKDHFVEILLDQYLNKDSNYLITRQRIENEKVNIK